MAKKLANAVASGSLRVKNVMSGECQFHAGGKAIGVAPGETVDLTPYIKTAADIDRIGGLRAALQAGRVVLV